MHRKFLATALALLFAGFTHAASETATKAPGKRAAVRDQATRPVSANPEEDLLARTVFQVLLGELALQRGKVDTSLGAYIDLARRSKDPRVLARAIEIATFARQYDLALELAQLWVQLDPESQKAKQNLSTILVLLNRVDELAPQISSLLAQDKENLADNLLRLNRMLTRHTDKKAVQKLIDKLAAPYAALPEAHYAMATAAVGASDMERALAEAGQALALRPNWEQAALLLAQLQARTTLSQAIGTLNGFVGSNPDAKEARLMLARLYISEKRYDESRLHFDRLLRDHPDNPDVIYPVAMLALQQGDTQTGKVQLEKLLLGNFPDKSTIHFFLGQIEEEQQRPNAALAHYREVSAGEQYVPARARASQILLQQGKADEARKLIQETAGRTPVEKTQLLLAESQLLREAKRFGEAYDLLNSSLRKQPDNIDLLYDAALVAERLGKPDILEKHLKRVLELKPDHAHSLNALGYSWADRNIHLKEAHELISKALALAPEDPFIMDSLGWVLFRQGKTEEALSTLQNAYRLKPDPEIAAHLGEVLWALNRKDDAGRILREAAKKNPDNEVLSATLKKLLP